MAGIIGVIGGAGVAATNLLGELIEHSVTRHGATRDAHHPEIIIWQATQVPSRSMFLEGRGPSFIEGYVDIARKLKNAGADTLCMCCNTAHYAIEDIAAQSGANFINLIAEVVLKAREKGKKHLGLIASDGCIRAGIYERCFASLFPDAHVILPDKTMQSQITKGICNIKSTPRFLPEGSPDNPGTIFSNVVESLYNKGAELIIIGCTDIRVAFTCDNSIDSLEVLAGSIIRESQKA